MENKRKMITRAQSKKAMENKDEENIIVTEVEEDINKKKGEKEEGNENKEEDKIDDDGKEKDEKEEYEKKKNVECEGERIVIDSVKRKKGRKRKEIYTLGVRSGGDFVFRTYSIVRRVPKQYKCSLCTDIFKTSEG